MKHRSFILRSTAILMFILVMLSQQQVRLSLKNGLELWAIHLVPTLFSVIFLAKYWMKLEIPDILITYVSHLKIPWKNKLYTLPVLLLGILCGIPVGGIYLSELERKEYIDSSTASRMLAICSMCSLAFLTDYAKRMYIGTNGQWVRILFSLYLPLPFLYLLIQRKNKSTSENKQIYYHSTQKNPPINECIIETIKTLLIMGGNILLCSTLIAISYSWLLPLPFGKILLSQAEITTGLQLLSEKTTHISMYYDLCYLSTMCFGGICTMSQVFSVMQNPHLSKITYVTWKIIHICCSIAVYYIIYGLKDYLIP